MTCQAFWADLEDEEPPISPKTTLTNTWTEPPVWSWSDPLISKPATP
jgi:hypothetical protein